MRVRNVSLPVAIGIFAAVLYNDWPLGYVFNPIASRVGLSSDLEAYGQPFNWFFIAGDIVCSLLIFIALWQLAAHITLKNRVTIAALSGLGLFGFMTIASAVLPLRCTANLEMCGFNPGQIHGLHDVTGALAAIGLFICLVAVWLLTRGAQHLNHWNGIMLILWSCWGLLFTLTPLPLIRQLPHIQLIGLLWEQVFLVLSGLGVALSIFSLDRFCRVETSK